MRKLVKEGYYLKVGGVEPGALVLIRPKCSTKIPSVDDVGVVLELDQTPDPATTVRRSVWYVVRGMKEDVSCDGDDLVPFMLACEPQEIPTAETGGVAEFLKKNAGEIISNLLQTLWHADFFKEEK